MMIDQTIVALDQMTLEDIHNFLTHPENSIKYVKIGLELYLKYGSDLVNKIHNEYHKKIFLDLKLHDIPVTVERSIHSLKNLPIDFLTIHLSGGEEMLTKAIAEARVSLPNCKVLGVSFLTSLSPTDLKSLYGISDIDAAFFRLFSLAEKTGIDGIICSPLEISLVKKHFPRLLIITPGIRFIDEINSSEVQDQKRVATPNEALATGANFIVIGRSLTKSNRWIERIKLLSVPVSIL